MKFPSQRKLLYYDDSISNDALGLISSGGTGSGAVCLPKDLAIVNRRNYASTTRKGVPLVYRVKVDLYSQALDATGPSAAVGGDFQTTLKIDGCQNNWVMRNAAVKYHAARENQFKKNGIKKSQRGAYSHEIRYGYDAYNQTWLTPIDGDGNAFVGGTWDLTTIATEEDVDMKLTLVGAATSEDADLAVTQLNLPFSYLSSRGQVKDDTNVEQGSIARNSILNDMLASASPDDDIVDNIRDIADSEQDNPPYDIFSVSDTNNDVTEPVELCRIVAGVGSSLHASAIIDVPFGIMSMKASHFDAADTNTIHGIMVALEVLDIYEMEG